jgi:hypothetical protein
MTDLSERISRRQWRKLTKNQRGLLVWQARQRLAAYWHIDERIDNSSDVLYHHIADLNREIKELKKALKK